jgi:hypothetical protein
MQIRWGKPPRIRQLADAGCELSRDAARRLQWMNHYLHHGHGGGEFAAEFEQACQARGLPLFVLPPRSPKLNGHVERAHRTHNEEFYEVTPQRWNLLEVNRQLLAWERTSNTIRPHQALGYATPLESPQIQFQNRKVSLIMWTSTDSCESVPDCDTTRHNMSLVRAMFILFAAALCCPASPFPQGGPGPIRPPSSIYENSAEGLRRLMTDILDSARRGDRERVQRAIKDMEIPDFKSWSATAFVGDKAKTWSDTYGPGLETNEAALEKLFVQLVQLRGLISARKLSDSQATNNGPEATILASLKEPIDLYVAEWRDSQAPADAKGEPIGYFFYVGGSFRWNSVIALPTPCDLRSDSE